MIEALLWGLISTSSLLVGAVIALRFKIPKKVIGLIMAFGVGSLISSVCFELVEEAFNETQEIWIIAAGLATGALVYFVGDLLISRFGGKNRKNYTGADEGADSGTAILLGTVLDGVPESIVVGLTIVGGGGVSVAMVVAVFLSNVPEALTSSTGLLASGWKKRSIAGLWLIVIAVSILAVLAGYFIFADMSGLVRALILSFAGGAILTMLANTMIPEAYRDSGKLTGLIVVLGFCLAFAITAIS